MLPSGGWDTEYLNVELLPPRDEFKRKLVGKSTLFSTSEVYTLTWAAGVFTLVNSTDVVQWTLSIPGVISCDLTFDQEDRAVTCWEVAGDISSLMYWDTVTSAYLIIEFEGNNPCCCVDNLRVNLPSDSDVVVFFQRDNQIYYVLQREDFLVEHTVPTPVETITLITCGMSTDNTLSLKTQQQDCVLFAIGTKPMVIGDDYVGYPTGVVPWDRN